MILARNHDFSISAWDAFCREMKKLADADGKTIEGRLYHCINHIATNLTVSAETRDQCVLPRASYNESENVYSDFRSRRTNEITHGKNNTASDMITEWRTRTSDSRPIGPMKEYTRTEKDPKLMTARQRAMVSAVGGR